MRALPHFGLGILAIPCDTVRGYVCETSRNRAKPRETTAKPSAKSPRNLAKPRKISAKPRDITRETGAKPRDISAKPARNRAISPRNHRETIRFARGRLATLDIGGLCAPQGSRTHFGAGTNGASDFAEASVATRAIPEPLWHVRKHEGSLGELRTTLDGAPHGAPPVCRSTRPRCGRRNARKRVYRGGGKGA